ncbi:GNAT family N-acetyltransferase [bacterium]|nr:GNAT family N-acetyltransferase [bacterium]
MSFWGTAGTTLRHFRQSVRAQYGGGISGFVQFVYYSFLRINTFVIFVRNCRETRQPITIEGELHIKRQVLDELNILRQQSDLSREFYGDHFGGKDFFLAYWDRKPAYIHWVFSAGTQSRFLRLEKKCAEIAYMLTLPEFRGRRICSQVVDHTVRLLSGEDVERVFCVIHEHNIASIKAVQRTGFHEFRKVRSIGPFNSRLKVTAL